MDGEKFTRYSRDVHCVYLQIWYELGVVGAALFALLGLAILQRLQRMPHSIIPYAHGAFASAAATIAASYGLWRPWFNLMFVLGVIAFAIGLRSLLRRQHLLQAVLQLNHGTDGQGPRPTLRATSAMSSGGKRTARLVGMSSASH